MTDKQYFGRKNSRRSHAYRSKNGPTASSAEQLTEQNVETVTKLERAARKQRTPTDPPGREDCEFHSIAEKVGADLSQDPQLQALSEETQPERLIEQLKRGKTANCCSFIILS